MTDPHHLQRFVDAQHGIFDTALAELRAGSKQSHWMWFVFPQGDGLGCSTTSRYFAPGSLDKARAYLKHPLLGPRLRLCVEALLHWAGERTPEQILGPVDALKLKSSLTLFDLAEPNALFERGLDALFDGDRDPRTLALLNATR